jgi:CRP/FNR family transcriptional regulator, cyclic AMP receptor protein
MRDGASLKELTAGEMLWRSADRERLIAPLALVVDGLIRVYMLAPTGREVTVRYASDGALIGLPATIGGEEVLANTPANVQAVTRSRVLLLSGTRLRSLAATDATVAWPVAQYFARAIHSSERLWMSNMFLPIRVRLAYHLLDLAIRQDGQLIVLANQQDLANAVGSVREVIARTLLGFADEGLVSRTSGGLVLTLPAELHRLAADVY